MFSVEDLSATEGKVVLTSPKSRVEILPGCGAILNAWYVQTAAGTSINIIEGYDSPGDFAQNVTGKGFRSCKMNPFAGRMARGGYVLEGVSYVPQKFSLKGMPIHGLVYDAVYEIIHSHADEKGAVLQLETRYTGDDEGYPFTYKIMVEYLLQPDERLTLNTIVLNQHEAPIPLADGWHPYFNLGNTIDSCTFEMAADTLVEFSEDLVPSGNMLPYATFQQHQPIGTTEWDNSFMLPHPLSGPACSFTNPQNGLKLQVWPEASYPILHLYTPPGRQSLAIENTSSVPNAFNNGIGLLYLQPSNSHTFSTTFKIIAQ